MSRPRSVEQKLRKAFERLKSNTQINMPTGTKVTMSNVAYEADIVPNAFRKERYPELHREVRAWIEIYDATSKNKSYSKKKKRESDSKTIKRLRNRNQKLLSQMNSLTAVIEKLEAKIEILEQNNIVILKKK